MSIVQNDQNKTQQISEGANKLTEIRSQHDPFLKPIHLAGHELKHRIAMAPMTRFRGLDAGVVNANAAEYYSERATPGGLLISEGLAPHPRGRGFPRTPGIYAAEQVEAWKPITAAVKAKGAVFFAQLWQVSQIQ